MRPLRLFLLAVLTLLVGERSQAQQVPAPPTTMEEVLYQACKLHHKCTADAACITDQLMRRISDNLLKQAYRAGGVTAVERLDVYVLLTHPEIVDNCTSSPIPPTPPGS